jgi:predicted ATPase/class 3 adenylate cyclase
MVVLPDGVVTFLFTDVEGSTHTWEEAPDSMMEALRRHDEVIDGAVAAHRGVSVKPRGEGDSRFVVFRVAVDAVAAAADMQRGLAEVEWPTPRPLRVRASLHTGVAELELGDYYGSAVNRAARLRAIAHGGQTVLSGSTFELVQDHLPGGVTVTDMGRHRLKDLTRPEHVFQLNVDGLDDVFAPLVSLDAVPNNLPEQLTDLIGRETELADVGRLLGQTRLLTILAPGGTGKTRLAIQAAADRTADYPDGVFFIALADIAASSDIVQTVAESVGVALSSAEDPQTQLLDYLAPRRQLLVFDNFEHLSDGAVIVSEILKAAPQVTVIATSRSKLNLTGEAVMALGGLDTSWDTQEEALRTSAVQLFLAAAQRARPGLALQPEDLDPLAQVLDLTGGMPLAILLAAAWVNMLSIAEIASEIAKSLDFLESDMGDVPDRHRSIRAVFDYTWQLLSPQERNVFAALSVFRGGFTREAAEAVAGASLRDLANLTNKSLATPNPDTGRYTVHELLRQYAEAELENTPDRHSSVHDAHTHYYSHVAEEAIERMFENEPGMLARIEEDIDNIRTAWHHSLATGNAVAVRKMIFGLYFLYEVRGWYPAGLELFAEALEALDERSDHEATAIARASALALHSDFSAMLGRQPEAAADAASMAAESLRAFIDPEALFFSLVLHGQCLLYLRRFDELTVVYDELIPLGETVAPSDWATGPVWVAGQKNVRAFVLLAAGDVDLAKQLLDESKEVLEPLDELFYMTWNLGHRARVAIREGRPKDAIDLFSRSADRARKIGFARGLQVSLAGLGDTNLATGDLAAAEAAFIESLDAAQRTSMVPEMLGTMVKIAKVLAASGRQTEAVELLSTVLAEPASNRQLFTESTPIDSMASAELEKLQREMEPGEYEKALAAGSSRSYRIVVKELIDSIS